MPSDNQAPPQASLELDVSEPAGVRATPAGPATTAQITAELCSFREDVHGLRKDQRNMVDKLTEGQAAINDRMELVGAAITLQSEKLDTMVGLLERIATATERAGDEMDKLEDVVRLRSEQEKVALDRAERAERGKS